MKFYYGIKERCLSNTKSCSRECDKHAFSAGRAVLDIIANSMHFLSAKLCGDRWRGYEYNDFNVCDDIFCSQCGFRSGGDSVLEAA